MRPKTKYKALLAQPDFTYRRLRRLPGRVLALMSEELRDNLDITEDEYLERVILREQLEPLELDDVLSISMEHQSRYYYNEYGDTVCGFHAETVVPYSGSAALWTAKPAPDFAGAKLGVVHTSQVKLLTVSDSRNWDDVEHEMSQWLPEARRAINAFGPKIIMFNLRLPDFVAPTVGRWFRYYQGQSRRRQERNASLTHNTEEPTSNA